MRQKNLALKRIYDACEKNGLDPAFLFPLYNTAQGKVVISLFIIPLIEGGWVNEYKCCTQKGLDLLAYINDELKVKSKPSTAIKIIISDEKVKEYREMFPEIKFP